MPLLHTILIMIKHFDSINAQALSDAIGKALQVVAKDYGLELSLGNIKLSKYEFRTALLVKVKVDFDDPVIVVENTIKSRKIGYSDNIIGKLIKYKDKIYIISNINPRRPKFCLEAYESENPKNRLAFSLGYAVPGVTYKPVK